MSDEVTSIVALDGLGAALDRAPVDWDTVEKHSLQSEWAFWYDEHKKAGDLKEYKQSLRQLGSFNTVEDFWRHYAYLSKPDTFRECSVYMVRGAKVVPAWETYPDGGCWLVRVRKKNTLIDRLWEELLFACIGELFAMPDVVCVGVSTRLREDVLSIWNCSNENDQTRFLIGEKIRTLLNLDATTNVEYKTFRHSIIDKSSYKHTVNYAYTSPQQVYQQQQQFAQYQKQNKKAEKKTTAAVVAPATNAAAPTS